MTAQDFFWLVCRMRSAQQDYYRTRAHRELKRAKAIETDVDEEIRRVKEILIQRGEY